MWTLYEGDCFDYFHLIEDKSIDMVLCDLPYGTTACKWDTPLPLDKLWEQYERVIKPNGAIVLTASQPFTSILVNSNLKLFKYCWVWDKVVSTGHLLAKKIPMKQHEDILVFMDGGVWYNPQGLTPYNKMVRRGNNGENFHPSGTENFQEFTNYPRSIIQFNKDRGLHPTQKPVALFEYLIRTYTNPGDTVLDNCAGSGTTGVACENTGRNSILMEKEPEYCQIIRQRLMEVTNQTKLPIEAK